MKNRSRTMLLILADLLLCAMCIGSFLGMALSRDADGQLSAAGLRSLKYFTVDSNIICGIAALIEAVALIPVCLGKREDTAVWGPVVPSGGDLSGRHDIFRRYDLPRTDDGLPVYVRWIQPVHASSFPGPRRFVLPAVPPRRGARQKALLSGKRPAGDLCRLLCLRGRHRGAEDGLVRLCSLGACLDRTGIYHHHPHQLRSFIPSGTLWRRGKSSFSVKAVQRFQDGVDRRSGAGDAVNALPEDEGPFLADKAVGEGDLFGVPAAVPVLA